MQQYLECVQLQIILGDNSTADDNHRQMRLRSLYTERGIVTRPLIYTPHLHRHTTPLFANLVVFSPHNTDLARISSGLFITAVMT
ncbi:MAG: hypothetical protein ABF326_03675 [Arenicellales bacterium]